MTALCFWCFSRFLYGVVFWTATLHVTMFSISILFTLFNVFLLLFLFLPLNCTLTSALANLRLFIQKSRKINHLSTNKNYSSRDRSKKEKRLNCESNKNKFGLVPLSNFNIDGGDWRLRLASAAGTSSPPSLRSVHSEKCQGTWPWKTSEGYVCIFAVSSELI